MVSAGRSVASSFEISTKWVEHDQVERGKGRELLEISYLKIIRSEDEPRSDHIGRVFLCDTSHWIKQKDETQTTR